LSNKIQKVDNVEQKKAIDNGRKWLDKLLKHAQAIGMNRYAAHGPPTTSFFRGRKKKPRKFQTRQNSTSTTFWLAKKNSIIFL
jgi:hypothetical protein